MIAMNYLQIPALILTKCKKLINIFYICGYNKAMQTIRTESENTNEMA